MRYQVRFVSDHSLPEGVTWAFARQGDRVYLFVKESSIDRATGRCDALDRARVVWYESEARSIRRTGPLSLVSRLGIPVHAMAGWQALARHAVV